MNFCFCDVKIYFFFPFCNYQCGNAVSDQICDRTRLAHETINAEDQREGGNGDISDDRQKCGQRDKTASRYACSSF